MFEDVIHFSQGCYSLYSLHSTPFSPSLFCLPFYYFFLAPLFKKENRCSFLSQPPPPRFQNYYTLCPQSTQVSRFSFPSLFICLLSRFFSSSLNINSNSPPLTRISKQNHYLLINETKILMIIESFYEQAETCFQSPNPPGTYTHFLQHSLKGKIKKKKQINKCHVTGTLNCNDHHFFCFKVGLTFSHPYLVGGEEELGFFFYLFD